MLKDIFFKLNKKASDERHRDGSEKKQETIMTKCPSCKKILYSKDLHKRLNVCSNCDHHMPIISTDRMDALLDIDSGKALFENITSVNPLNFPNYEEKLASDKEKTGLKEALIVSHGKIMGNEAVVAIMDPRFRMGSLGSRLDENFQGIFQYRTELTSR